MVALLIGIALPAAEAVGEETIDLFDSDVVLNANRRDRAGGRPLAESAEAARLGGDLAAARELYIQALAWSSEGDWYYELGSVAFLQRDFVLSERSFVMAALLGYDHIDFAWYNAACAASMREDAVAGFSHLSNALRSGYRYYNHLRTDRDIAYLRSLDAFDRVVLRHLPPPSIASPEAEIGGMTPYATSYVTANLDEDTDEELVVTFVFPNDPDSELGAYYFAFYDAADAGWRFINSASGGVSSVPPSGERTERWLFNRIRLADRGRRVDSFIVAEVDGTPGHELIVPSSGLSYSAGKVLDVVAGRLQEIGEIEGFEGLFRTDRARLLVGRPTGDYASLHSEAHRYSAYELVGTALIPRPLPRRLVAEVAALREAAFHRESTIYRVMDWFWFLYNHSRHELSAAWIHQRIDEIVDTDSVELHVEAMLSAIE